MYRCITVLDSIAPNGSRVLTFEIEFPRIVLAETVTHRINSQTGEVLFFADRTTTPEISKNSASSRAIPIKTMIQKVIDDPYIPERFSKNQAGMQESAYLEGTLHDLAVEQWKFAMDRAVNAALVMSDLGVHKQDANRLLEPFSWVTQVLTASEDGLSNFFAQRCHKDAHPAFRKIARMMYIATQNSIPHLLKYDEWHLPYYDQKENGSTDHTQERVKFVPTRCNSFPPSIKISAARCAWVSYFPPSDIVAERSATRALDTYEKLTSASPMHPSPMEHQLTPLFHDADRFMVGNIEGWIQFRKLHARERVHDFKATPSDIASWDINHSFLYHPRGELS